MNLRNGTVKGQVVLPPEFRPRFEQGVVGVFQRWMALRLAVDNGWGGAKSCEKADQMIADTLHWFYTKRGARRGGRGGGCEDATQPLGGGAAGGALACHPPHHPQHSHIRATRPRFHRPSDNAEHYADELEIELDEALTADFNLQAEDGSPMEVAKALVGMYHQCLVGAWVGRPP